MATQLTRTDSPGSVPIAARRWLPTHLRERPQGRPTPSHSGTEPPRPSAAGDTDAPALAWECRGALGPKKKQPASASIPGAPALDEGPLDYRYEWILRRAARSCLISGWRDDIDQAMSNGGYVIPVRPGKTHRNKAQHRQKKHSLKCRRTNHTVKQHHGTIPCSAWSTPRPRSRSVVPRFFPAHPESRGTHRYQGS